LDLPPFPAEFIGGDGDDGGDDGVPGQLIDRSTLHAGIAFAPIGHA